MKRFILKVTAMVVALMAFTVFAQNAHAGMTTTNCGQMNGAYQVSCQGGVHIYRSPVQSSYVQPSYRVTLPARTNVIYGTSQQSQRNIAMEMQLENRRLALEEKKFEAEQRAIRMQERRARYNRPYSRRYVTYSGRNYGYRRPHSRRHSRQGHQAKHAS